jgi:8-oxo-dGTP pyrophosphatase MutT (NUDIX family)
MPLRISAFAGPAELPSEFVVSVRCIVEVADQLVVCQNADGVWHPWPGGRREPGETYAETARREVHEETGWLLEPESLQDIGWLHFEHLKAQPADHPYPHPDWLQIVYRAAATTRDGDHDTEWTDTEGYEQRSKLVGISEARDLVIGDALSIVFQDVLAHHSR